MIIGIPREIKSDENRVSVLPFGVDKLTKEGNKVIVETDAGLHSGYSNDYYISAGAEIIDNPTDRIDFFFTGRVTCTRPEFKSAAPNSSA